MNSLGSAVASREAAASLPRRGSASSLTGLGRSSSKGNLAGMPCATQGAGELTVKKGSLLATASGDVAVQSPRTVLRASPSASALMELASSDLHDYILQGPLLSSCGLDATTLDLAEWVTTGKQLAKQLNFDHDQLDNVQKLRIYHYYLPIYFWCQSQLEAHRASGATSALVLGISAPQGCGKTTVVEQLELLFAWAGRKAASVSIDDFYLTNADQTALAAANPSNRLLQYRGNAGTHDLALGTETLKALRGLSQPGASAAVPRYDKSAFAGRGDRAPLSTWPVVQAPLDVVLFEGWMSGFAPLTDAELASQPGEVQQVNQHLHAYKDAWDSLVDSWLVIRIGDPQWVYQWRLQAEERMRASGKPGLSDEQVADFVSRFMPAYDAYLPQLYKNGPTTCRPGKTLIVEVDQNRAPVPQQPAPVV